MEFVKGKPKGTNPAIMGNPIDMYAVNDSKKTINLITRETTSKSIEPCTMQKTKLHYSVICYAMLCRIVLCYARLCFTLMYTLFFVLICYTALCCAILFYAVL